MVAHDDRCEGGHTDGISCVQVRKIRAAARVNVWICSYGRNGYHSFSTEETNEVCNYNGCSRTRGELNASLRRGTPTSVERCVSSVCSVSPESHLRQAGCPGS